MAFRTWVKLSGSTVCAAALAGASQLGLAYGLGILRMTRVVEITARDQWTAQLSWVAWIAMTAAVVGGMAARSRLPRQSGPGARIVAAVAAALGGAVVVPLTMQPARTAHVAGVHPVFVIGVCAGLGAVAGGFAAYAAISRAVTRWGLITVGVAIWLVAITSVLPPMTPGASLPAARLGVFDAAVLDPSVTRRTALLTMPALALICGAVLGWAARRRSMSTVVIALAGLPGPALLTLAYLIAGPGDGEDRYQAVPYWAAMTAAGAGVLGSVLTAVLRRGPAVDAAEAAPEPRKPTPDRPPLPRRDVQPDSAIARAAVVPQRPDDQGPPPEAPVVPMTEKPPFDGFTPVPGPPSGPVQGRARPVPTAISAPLPNPQPINAPPTARGRNQQPGGDIADWVSGLGGPVANR
jgi:hypothetical protein